jgi:hypothetical protein
MNPKRITLFTVLLYAAYIFFLGLGAFWFYENFAAARHFNYAAFGIILVFAIQLFFRRRLVNLVLGIITLFFSIWMFLEVIGAYNLFAKGTTLDVPGKLMLTVAAVSIFMSGILIFSYQALNKENMNKGK